MQRLTHINEQSLKLIKQIPSDKLKLILKIMKIDRNGKILVETVSKSPYFFFALIVYFISGKITFFSLSGLETIFDFKEIISYLFGLICLIFALLQNKLRKKTVKELAQKIKELELIIDPNRKSSNLTNIGETNADDK